eukprot:jgi/Mesen1/1495/ME000132S00441
MFHVIFRKATVLGAYTPTKVFISNFTTSSLSEAARNAGQVQVGDPCVCRLASVLERLPSLRVLDLSYNRLTEVPASVCALHQLEELDLSGDASSSFGSSGTFGTLTAHPEMEPVATASATAAGTAVAASWNVREPAWAPPPVLHDMGDAAQGRLRRPPTLCPLRLAAAARRAAAPPSAASAMGEPMAGPAVKHLHEGRAGAAGVCVTDQGAPGGKMRGGIACQPAEGGAVSADVADLGRSCVVASPAPASSADSDAVVEVAARARGYSLEMPPGGVLAGEENNVAGGTIGCGPEGAGGPAAAAGRSPRASDEESSAGGGQAHPQQQQQQQLLTPPQTKVQQVQGLWHSRGGGGYAAAAAAAAATCSAQKLGTLLVGEGVQPWVAQKLLSTAAARAAAKTTAATAAAAAAAAGGMGGAGASGEGPGAGVEGLQPVLRRGVPSAAARGGKRKEPMVGSSRGRGSQKRPRGAEGGPLSTARRINPPFRNAPQLGATAALKDPPLALGGLSHHQQVGAWSPGSRPGPLPGPGGGSWRSGSKNEHRVGAARCEWPPPIAVVARQEHTEQQQQREHEQQWAATVGSAAPGDAQEKNPVAAAGATAAAPGEPEQARGAVGVGARLIGQPVLAPVLAGGVGAEAKGAAGASQKGGQPAPKRGHDSAFGPSRDAGRPAAAQQRGGRLTALIQRELDEGGTGMGMEGVEEEEEDGEGHEGAGAAEEEAAAKKRRDMERRKKKKQDKRREQRQLAEARGSGGGGGGGDKRRRPHTPAPPSGPPVCKFFREGKCAKGAECTFSHDVVPVTKGELCRFFVLRSCLKGPDCAYSHDLAAFPCKFFHTTGRCLDGEQCRFSHAAVTTPLQREGLERRLEQAAKQQQHVPTGGGRQGSPSPGGAAHSARFGTSSIPRPLHTWHDESALATPHDAGARTAWVAVPSAAELYSPGPLGAGHSSDEENIFGLPLSSDCSPAYDPTQHGRQQYQYSPEENQPGDLLESHLAVGSPPFSFPSLADPGHSSSSGSSSAGRAGDGFATRHVAPGSAQPAQLVQGCGPLPPAAASAAKQPDTCRPTPTPNRGWFAGASVDLGSPGTQYVDTWTAPVRLPLGTVASSENRDEFLESPLFAAPPNRHSRCPPPVLIRGAFTGAVAPAEEQEQEQEQGGARTPPLSVISDRGPSVSELQSLLSPSSCPLLESSSSGGSMLARPLLSVSGLSPGFGALPGGRILRSSLSREGLAGVPEAQAAASSKAAAGTVSVSDLLRKALGK